MLELPATVAQLKSLQKIWLTHNALRGLPDSLTALSGLHSLLAPDNVFKELPQVRPEEGKSCPSPLSCPTEEETAVPHRQEPSAPWQPCPATSTTPAHQMSNKPALARPGPPVCTYGQVVTRLESLQQLFFNLNPIRELPPGIGALTNLEWL
jgi:Leucine-rich repeat (LRR) protein